MFTGIIEARGTVVDLSPTRRDGAALTVRAGHLARDLRPGDSLAVAGVCLTSIEHPDPDTFRAEVMGETLRRTGLGALEPGREVNLERALPATGRFDGHVVQGHVDGVGTVERIEDLGDWTRQRIRIPAELAAFLAEKGSIAVDGTSLTVTAVSPPGEAKPWFEIGLIPTTLAATTLGALEVGDTVNLETDVIAKYVSRLQAVTETGSRS